MKMKKTKNKESKIPNQKSPMKKIPLILLALTTLTTLSLRADWTHPRANPERTGTRDTDASAVPIHKPKVLWAYKAKEHFVASPVPEKNLLFISALGAFNTAQFHAVSTDDTPASALMPATKRG